MSDDVKEENLLEIDLALVDDFCMSSARERSITRDLAERLVFAQLSEITSSNVFDYYSRLSVIDHAYNSALMYGSIFDEQDNQLDDRQLKVIDFISRIGVKTNLKKDTLRNFLERIAAHLAELKAREMIDKALTYDELAEYFFTSSGYFFDICKLNNIDLSPDNPIFILNSAIDRALDLCRKDAAGEVENV